MAEQEKHPVEETLASQFQSKAEERVSVASNLQLVWWRFKKNRLALIAAALLIFFYIIVLIPDFFATVSDSIRSFLVFGITLSYFKIEASDL